MRRAGSIVLALALAGIGLVAPRPVAAAGTTAPFLALTPARLLDTRLTAPVDDESTTELVVAGQSGVPADAMAVLLNVTVVGPEGDGYLTVFPCGTVMPLASNLNYQVTKTIGNVVTAYVGTGGAVCIYSLRATHLVVDLEGAYSPSLGVGYLAADPAVRVLDTRVTPPALTKNTELQLTLPNAGDATAAIVQLTAIRPARNGYITVYPCGIPTPDASSLNYEATYTRGGQATTPLGAGGTVCIYASSDMELAVDVLGFYRPGSGLALQPTDVVRLNDTRVYDYQNPHRLDWVDSIVVGYTRVWVESMQITGPSDVPSGTQAVVLDIAAWGTPNYWYGGTGYLAVYPCDEPRPAISSLNFNVRAPVAMMVTSRLSADGKVCFAGSPQFPNVVVDLQATFTAAATA